MFCLYFFKYLRSKDGIIYDAKQLLADVAQMVQDQKDEILKVKNVDPAGGQGRRGKAN